MKIISTLVTIGSLLGAANLFAGSTTGVAASTFIPVPVQYLDGSGHLQDTSKSRPLVANACYASIDIVEARVFANTSLWSAIWNTNALAFATARLSGQAAGPIAIAVTRTGGPVRVQRGDTIKDMGISAKLLDAVPWTFQNLNLHLEMDSSADSTIAGVIGGLSQVSSKLPGFTLSSSVTAGLSIANIFDTLLFAPGRSDARLRGDFDLTAAGDDTLREGYYVVFGADSATNYNKYLGASASGGTKLEWNNQRLLFGTTPVDDVSYFVIKVHRQDTLWGDDSRLAMVGDGKPWSQDLVSVLSDIVTLASASGSDDQAFQQAKQAIVKGMNTGKTLLLADPDVLASEKLAILTNLQKTYLAETRMTLAALQRQALAQDTSPPAPPGTSTNSSLPDGTYVTKSANFDDAVKALDSTPTVHSEGQADVELRAQRAKSFMVNAVKDLTAF